MRLYALTCVAIFAAAPAAAQQATQRIELLPGHPILHESEREAGIAMALSIALGRDQATTLTALCEELRTAAGLPTKNEGELRLETLFVVPYKGMIVEGYYWPEDSPSGKGELVAGKAVARQALDDIVTRAGIPPRILDETDVEHEVSCEMGEPLWHVVWHDVRLIGDEEPEVVIERARQRFLAVHQSVVEHNGRTKALKVTQATETAE